MLLATGSKGVADILVSWLDMTSQTCASNLFLTRFGFHLHLLVDICHPFSVFLSVSGTLFRPLPYLRVVVFLPSDLFFTLSTKQINFLLVFNFQS